ncbi:MAG TPA: hypothetical protein VGS23_07125 [Thermoplasmata archaeon]|nr:hypothetical protein [Thermoplasmata archaeon]
MTAMIFLVPAARRTELDQALNDDVLARQSRKVRDAGSMGGPSGELYVLIEGASEAMTRAETLIGPLGKKLAPPDAAKLEQQFKDEDESASAGMGLFFTE